MSKIPFKVSARAGKLFGRENFSNPEGAIIELVKNSYDADASEVTLLLKDSTEKEILVSDNGHGMSFDEIKEALLESGWYEYEIDEVVTKIMFKKESSLVIK